MPETDEGVTERRPDLHTPPLEGSGSKLCAEKIDEREVYGSWPLANREIRSANHSSCGIWIIQPLTKYVGVALTPTR